MGILSYFKNRLAAKLDPYLHPVFGDVFESAPLVIYDVGAAGEIYCPIEGGPCDQVRVYGFEPVKSSYDDLVQLYADNRFVEIRQAALSDRDGVVKINQLEEGLVRSSSLYSQDDLDLNSQQVEVESARLDSVPKAYGFLPPDFIKLDTEGSEGLILEAGPEMLGQEVLSVVTEFSFWRRDAGGAVFSDMDQMLTRSGFILFDLQINRSHTSMIGGKKDKMRSGDALYLRDFVQLSEQIKGKPKRHRRTKLIKLISLCVAWRYLNYALELADYGLQEGLITAGEYFLLSDAFAATTDFANLIPGFPGRARIAGILDVLAYNLHRHAKKSIPSNFNGIGNSWVVPRKGGPLKNVTIYKPVIANGISRRMKIITVGGEPN